LFCCEHLESVHGGAEVGALDRNKTCAQVLERYNGVWIEISWRRWSGVAGIYRLRLGRQCSRQKEHLGCCFSLGSTMITWFNRKQTSVALSSVEAEYMAVSMASCEAIWLHKLLTCLFDQELEPTVIYCDNQSCIKLSENPVFHDRSKHIEIIYHFIRDRIQKGAVKLQYISTDEQVADILTKPLEKGKFVFFRDRLGVVQNTFLTKREC
jgi:hypothetical protein